MKRGCQIWRGSQLLPLCANGGARRPEPFDGAKSAHTHKDRLILTSSADPGEILQTPVVDLEHRCSFGPTQSVPLSVATGKNTPQSSPDLIPTLPGDVARAVFQMSPVSLVLLVLLIIPRSVEKSVLAISRSLSFQVSHV